LYGVAALEGLCSRRLETIVTFSFAAMWLLDFVPTVSAFQYKAQYIGPKKRFSRYSIQVKTAAKPFYNGRFIINAINSMRHAKPG
jgi:hypothetical protein